MSNEVKSGNMNDQNDRSKNDPNRTVDAPKGDQQSQGTTPVRTDKGMPQQGGSDHKSGQQSQGGSRADDDGMKQVGSSTIVNDAKKPADTTQKSASPKVI
jgi:hypothetical protein